MTTEYISAKILAKRWGLSHRTLQRWRDNNEGPAFIKIGSQVVRYLLEDVQACEADKFTRFNLNNKK